MRYLIYALRDADDQTIYVGQTSDVDKRLKEHRNNSWWSEVASHRVMAYTPTRSLAREVESAMINAIRPRHNRQGNPEARTTHLSVPVYRHAITEQRERKGWSKADLAQRIGVDRTLITRIENGQRSPSPTVMRKLADALDCPLHALMGPSDEEVAA